MLIQQKQAIFPLCDLNTTLTASSELNSIDMALYDHATFIIHVASTLSWSVGASAVVFSIESGTSDSSDTADVTFHYAVNTASAATLSTVMTYSADATSSALSFSTVGDLAGHCLILQVDADELRTTSLGKVYNWLTVDFTNATTGTIDAFCILSNPRYTAADLPVAV
jgi:hypothetical protein